MKLLAKNISCLLLCNRKYQKAAEHIASVTGGDLFELVPVKPYSREDLNGTMKTAVLFMNTSTPRKERLP